MEVPLVVTDSLRKVYKDGTVALDGVTMELRGKISCLLGRNGAGKTTMTKILSTQMKPTSGKAEVLGMDVVREARELRRRVTSVPQEAKPVGIASPLEHLVMFLTAKGYSISESIRRSREVLKTIGLGNVMEKSTDELSGGMKRKVFVAMAIASESEAVFLDEPTTGLDPISRIEVWSALRELDSNIVLTTHYMEEAEELCEKIAVIDRGRLWGIGSPQELLSPMRGLVRVEGRGDIIVGRTRISYVPEAEAGEMVKMGYTVKRISLEDLFIRMGIEVEN